MKAHRLKHRHNRRREKRYAQWLLTAKYIKQFDEKTHPLKQRYGSRREKRYVVVTHSRIHQTIQ